MLKPSTDVDWEISKDFPYANPSAISKSTTLPSSLILIRCANVPPICPAPINVIFFFINNYFITGITNSGSDLKPDGHFEVIVFNFV